jgi:hypothetical protein
LFSEPPPERMSRNGTIQSRLPFKAGLVKSFVGESEQS